MAQAAEQDLVAAFAAHAVAHDKAVALNAIVCSVVHAVAGAGANGVS